MDPFEKALAYTLVNEGGYVNNPADPGGATNMGISTPTLTAWNKANNKPPPTAAEVKALTAAEAGCIYRLFFWSPLGADGLKSEGMAMVLFDAGVLCGVGYIARLAQTLAASLSGQPCVADGKIGPKTVALLNQCDGPNFIQALVIKQQQHFISLVLANPALRQFHKTWQRRNAAYLELALPPLPSTPALAVAAR